MVCGKADVFTADCCMLCSYFKLVLNARMVCRFGPALHHIPTCSRDRGGGRTQPLSAIMDHCHGCGGISLTAWSVENLRQLAQQDGGR